MRRHVPTALQVSILGRFCGINAKFSEDAVATKRILKEAPLMGKKKKKKKKKKKYGPIIKREILDSKPVLGCTFFLVVLLFFFYISFLILPPCFLPSFLQFSPFFILLSPFLSSFFPSCFTVLFLLSIPFFLSFLPFFHSFLSSSFPLHFFSLLFFFLLALPPFFPHSGGEMQTTINQLTMTSCTTRSIGKHECRHGIGNLHDYVTHNLPPLLMVSVNLLHHRKCISIHDLQ